MPARWTKKEEEYLEEKWGVVSIPTIAKNLNKSIYAVKLKAMRMGLGRHLHSGGYITLNQLCKALGLGQSYTERYKSWVRHGLPIKYKKSVKKRFRVIYIDDFWKWAEKNKMLIDFSRMEKGILGEEPWWVKDKRTADIAAKKYKTTPWTKNDDALLIQMLNSYRYSYRDISIRLGRTEGAIKKRMSNLNLKQRPLKADNHTPWTPEEERILVDMYYMGYIPEVIAEKIPRSASAIKGKIERMVKEGRLRADRCQPLSKAGVSYKKALPEEKWPYVKHFLKRLMWASKISKRNNMRIDISTFLDEYKSAYRW